MLTANRVRLAIVVSHPIQYYVPLYRRLAKRDDIELKVFYTWHGGGKPSLDHGFKQELRWDIPLTEGYESEVVRNTAAKPGTHHFFGLRNPELISRLLYWRPEAVHVTGYAWCSHLLAIWELHRRGIPVLFRGDSHLLDRPKRGLRSQAKCVALRRIFKWPAAFLYVGNANRAYYEAFGVSSSRLYHCPHSIDVERFAQPAYELEREARAWRRELQIPQDRIVLVFAGKFEDKKRPIPLMSAVQRRADPRLMLVMVGDGDYGEAVRRIAASDPGRFRVLPFQNQSRMPLVYRLGDIFVLPSAYGETWGLAINEAIACGRPVLVSDKVGCAADIVQSRGTGSIFRADDWEHFNVRLSEMESTDWRANSSMVRQASSRFSIDVTEQRLIAALQDTVNPA